MLDDQPQGNIIATEPAEPSISDIQNPSSQSNHHHQRASSNKKRPLNPNDWLWLICITIIVVILVISLINDHFGSSVGYPIVISVVATTLGTLLCIEIIKKLDRDTKEK